MAEILLRKTAFLDAPISVESLTGRVFANEQDAHKFVISCMQSGQMLTLTGTVTAKFVRADGNTIQLVGAVENGAAAVTLAQDCYNVPGRFQLAVFNTVGGTTICVYACVGTVQRTQAGNLIDGGEIIDTIDDLIADIQTAVASIPPDYSSLVAEVTDLKSAIGIEPIVFTNGKYIENYKSPVDWTNMITGAARNNCAVVDATEGDVFTINGTGGNSGRLWCFVNQSGTILSLADSNATGTNLVITAPANSYKLVLNALDTVGLCCKGILTKLSIASLTQTTNDIRTVQMVYANDANVTVTAPSRLDTGIVVLPGQKFKITVTNLTGGGIYLFINGNSDVRHYIAQNEEYVFTPASSGSIIFNPDGGSANIKIHFVTVYDSKENGKAVYTVGDGGDYATFTAMLVDLEDDSADKIVYVNPGTYDIFDEMGGAEYLASLADTASTLNWRDVCHVVPPNTTIIGIGDVQLNWLPNASDVPNNAVKVLFSPLNTSGNCHIENITINAKNCRYALHDETSNKAQYYGAKHEYVNCKIYAEGTNAIGSGHCRNQSLIFKNCVLESSTGNSVFMHDWPSPANGKSNIIFENCVVTGGILLNSCDTVGRLDSFKLFNCFITNGNIHLIADDQTNSYLQGYTIEAIGTTQLNFTHYSNVTVSQAPIEYNVQSR